MLPLLSFTAQYDEPTRKYYIAVSPLYSLWIIYTLLFLPIEKFGYWLIVSLYKKSKKSKSVLQKELEYAMGRTPFDFTHEVPYFLAIATVVFYHVSGIPFLLMIFAVYSVFYFWIEKLMVLKFYKKPTELEGTSIMFADYIIIGILIMHIFCSIVAYGTSDVFPYDTKKVEGLRRGYLTNYYVAEDTSFFMKFGLPTSLVYLILLLLIILFMVLTYLMRNKIFCRKFKYFSMKYSEKMKYIPGTYTRVKNNCVIGETTYKIAGIEKYKNAVDGFDSCKYSLIY